jgi:DNA-binding HxlR family transcriptional regulator
MNDLTRTGPENTSSLMRLRMGELLARDCPSREVLNHVCSRWGVLVLVVLRDGMHRFSELRRKIGGVSEKMLAQTLQSLESDGFVDRKSLPVVPPHVEYRLTALGEEVAAQVDGLASWIEENLPRIMQAREARALEAD